MEGFIMHRIPVGYVMQPASQLEAGHTIHIEGKIIEVRTLSEKEEWFDLDSELFYFDTAIMVKIQRMKDGEITERTLPSSSWVRVLNYVDLL